MDWSLYLVTDPDQGGGPDEVPRIARDAVQGGVTVVQLRDKTATEAVFSSRAIAVRSVLPESVPLFINDRVEIASALGLHLHIGQSDLPYRVARTTLPEHCMIGLSVETPAQLDILAEDIADGIRPPDVLGLGPVEQTSTKPDAAAPLGIGGLAELTRRAHRLNLPCVAIGHVHPGNTADIIRTGVDGICTVSAIVGASDPQAAATTFRSIIDRTRLELP